LGCLLETFLAAKKFLPEIEKDRVVPICPMDFEVRLDLSVEPTAKLPPRVLGLHGIAVDYPGV
jgi:hypothetical protein